MFNEFAKRVYDFNVSMGWHQKAPDLAVYLMNLHGEISELWEAWRAGKVKPNDICRENMIGGCLIHDDKQIHRADGFCAIGRESLCDKAGKMRDLGHRPLTCLEEEIADILIRTLDTAHAYGVDIDRAVDTKMAYNATRGHRYGGKLA